MITGSIFGKRKTAIKSDIKTAEAIKLIKSKKHSWIDFHNFNKKEVQAVLKTIFPEFHVLIEEDIMGDERPKLEIFDGFIFMIFKIYPNNSSKPEQISVILGKDYILTFRQGKFNLDNTYSYFNSKQGAVDFVLYKILEDVFHHYYEYIDKIHPKVQKLEARSVTNPTAKVLNDILSLKRTILRFHRFIEHERDMLTILKRADTKQIKPKTKIYLRDIYDDSLHLLDEEHLIREGLSSNIQVHLSNLSNRTNETVKVLTVLSSFVLVPTLIASIYGMNFFNSMPELGWNLGYPFALGIIAISTITTFIWFKKKGWI